MVALTGYQVVLEAIDDVSRVNPTYRGIYRRPPWSQELYNLGFDDPYVFGDLVDEHGLIPTAAQAQEVLAKIAAVIPDKLEIIQVFEEIDEGEKGPTSFGFDVSARESPFWSLLADYPPDDWSREFLPLLNQYGLFDWVADARRFMERCLAAGVPDTARATLTAWRIDRFARGLGA